MDTLSKRSRSWRRPPLILVAIGLAIAYVELAAESEMLTDNELVVNKTTNTVSMTGNVGKDVVGVWSVTPSRNGWSTGGSKRVKAVSRGQRAVEDYRGRRSIGCPKLNNADTAPAVLLKETGS